jgi:opacity protein-like surface antigen
MNRTQKSFRLSLLIAMLLVALTAPAFAADHRIGVGVHHWQTVDDLADQGFEGLDEKGTSGILSYQYMPEGIFSFELDAEYFANGFGGSTESAYSPQVYLLVGHGLYAGAGVGVVASDGEKSDPFYAAKVGFDFSIIPRVSLDVNANYRFDDWGLIDDAETDTITFGALLRFRI